MPTLDHASPKPSRIGLASATGLVVATMIGTGVFVSAGFMAHDLDAAAILIGWLLGGVFALCGALCYSAVAMKIPRSGGEYRFLYEAYHPYLGCLAGWISLVIGFAAPIAMAAIAAGAYAEVLIGKGAAMPLAITVVVGFAAINALGIEAGSRLQDLGALLKVGLIVAFVVGALFGGVHFAQALPTANTFTSLHSVPFAIGLVYIGYAYEGWNATTYIADEVDNPVRTVPRSLVLGCLAVTLLYLLLNVVFLSVLSPSELMSVARDETHTLTLGHLVATRLFGAVGGTLVSWMVLLVLVSSISAMTIQGPRVVGEMARDGFLPARFRWTAGATGGLWAMGLQTALTLLFLTTNTFETLLDTCGVTLALFGALSASAILRIKGLAKPGLVLALVVYLAGVGWSVTQNVMSQPKVLIWAAVTIGAASISYFLTGKGCRCARFHR